jgi:hypothetical protein
MADSGVTTLPDQILTAQAQKEVTANAAFDAMSAACFGGRRASVTTALTWGIYGGRVNVGGTYQLVADAAVTLTASATNYVEYDPATYTFSSNTSAFSAGRVPLYTVVTGVSTVTSYTDNRTWDVPGDPLLALNVAGSANVTLNATQDQASIISCTGAITANIQVILGLKNHAPRVAANLTSGAFTVTFIGPSGTGIVVAQGKRAWIYSDGTNVQRITPDT